YLYEQGVGYWKKNGKNTLVTEFDQSGGGWTFVDPAAAPVGIPVADTGAGESVDDNWEDGMPPPGQTVADNGQERRILRVNIMNCVNNDVQGKGDYPSEGNYL
ncbi:MAG: hypothetical protein GWN87_21985, partial [Desulfuromonadales bacterium]|nr:hypothetical protein [Desulfuromonadales bacterium]